MLDSWFPDRKDSEAAYSIFNDSIKLYRAQHGELSISQTTSEAALDMFEENFKLEYNARKKQSFEELDWAKNFHDKSVLLDQFDVQHPNMKSLAENLSKGFGLLLCFFSHIARKNRQVRTMVDNKSELIYDPLMEYFKSLKSLIKRIDPKGDDEQFLLPLMTRISVARELSGSWERTLKGMYRELGYQF